MADKLATEDSRTGHVYGNGGATGATTKGDYSLVMGDEHANPNSAELKDFGPSSAPGSGTRSSGLNSPVSRADRQAVDFVLNHPALPIFCYCSASIFMTVVNKVTPLTAPPLFGDARSAERTCNSLLCQASTLR